MRMKVAAESQLREELVQRIPFRVSATWECQVCQQTNRERDYSESGYYMCRECGCIVTPKTEDKPKRKEKK